MGFLFLDCSQSSLGFDALVATHGRLTPVEIKDGLKAPSRQRLTPHERETHARLLAHGVRIELLTSLADVESLGRELRHVNPSRAMR